MKSINTTLTKLMLVFAVLLTSIILPVGNAKASEQKVIIKNYGSCKIRSDAPVKNNNFASSFSKVSCTNLRIDSIKTTIQQQFIVSWRPVADSTNTNEPIASARVACRYGTSKNWRTETVVKAGGHYMFTYYSEVSKLPCDI